MPELALASIFIFAALVILLIFALCVASIILPIWLVMWAIKYLFPKGPRV